MNCHFCLLPMESQNPSNSVFLCRPCSNKYNMGIGHLLIDSVNINRVVILFKKNYQKIENPKYEESTLFEPQFKESGIEYTISLNLLDNYTTIEGKNLATGKKSLNIKIPGFSITPENAPDKVALYALFS